MKITNYRITKNIAWQEEPTEKYIYVFDLKSKNFIKLDDIGKIIWLGIINENSLVSINEIISKKYQVPIEIVSKDTSDFLLELESYNIIESSELHNV